MTYAPVILSKYIQLIRRRCIYKKIHYLAFGLDPDPKVKVTQNVSQFPLHYVISAHAKFAVAKSKCLGGDAFIRNVTEGWTDGRRTDFGMKLINPFFLKKKRV